MSDPPRKARFPNLAGVAQALDKLSHDVEEDARKFLESDVAGVAAKKDHVMKKARARLGDHVAALDDLKSELDKLDEMLGDNSGGDPGGDPGSRPTE